MQFSLDGQLGWARAAGEKDFLYAGVSPYQVANEKSICFRVICPTTCWTIDAAGIPPCVLSASHAGFPRVTRTRESLPWPIRAVYNSSPGRFKKALVGEILVPGAKKLG